MAHEHRPRRPSRQHSAPGGMGSSHSYLDGIPFKISPGFRPPPQPGVSSELLGGVPRCEALDEEYDYETEEAVLAWAHAREEAKIKAIAERARAAMAAAASDSSSDSEEEEDVTDMSQAAAGATTIEEAAPPPPLRRQGVTPPWQLPLAASVGTAILTPVPIQTTNTKVQSPVAPKTPLDLAMFEQERDPFDNMELQTIDDMEELRTLLEGVNTEGPASQDSSPNPDDQAVYSNSEMVNSQMAVSSNTQAEPTADSGRVNSSGDNIYVNVVVGPGAVEMESSEQSLADGEEGNDSVAALGSSSVSNSMCQSVTSNSSFVIEPTGDGDYVQIRADYMQQSVSSVGSVSSQRDVAPLYANVGPETDSTTASMSDDESQELYTNSEVFKPTQPPVLPRVQSLTGEHAPFSAAGRTASVVFNPAVRYSLPRTSGHFMAMPGRMSQSAYVWSESASSGQDLYPSSISLTTDSHTYSNFPPGSKSIMTASTPAFSNVLYGAGIKPESSSANPVTVAVAADTHSVTLPTTTDNHTYSNLPRSNVNSDIMTASTPAFSNRFYGYPNHPESESSAPENSANSSSGGLRNYRSNPDLSAAAQSTNPASRPPQPWNPYKPLPPTPVSDLRSSSSSTESLPTDPSQNLSPLILSPSASESGAAASAEEDDPYHSLSNEAKMFVNNLTSMGFSRSRASRAVEKFGADEREVLDHMFNVDKLVEKKFAPALAEIGLQLFKNDLQKAEQFLDLFQQFKELGFTSERIKIALVKHELDRDKALDYLTT